MEPKLLKVDGGIVHVEMFHAAVKAFAVFGILTPFITDLITVSFAFVLHSDLMFNHTYCPQVANRVSYDRI